MTGPGGTALTTGEGRPLDDWLRQSSSGELFRNTLVPRTRAVRQHLVPSLGARRVRELSADDVASSLQGKAAAGYSRASLDEMRGAPVQALRHAEGQGLVVRTSPAWYRRPPAHGLRDVRSPWLRPTTRCRRPAGTRSMRRS